MQYREPKMEIWDLEEEMIVTSLGNGEKHEEGGGADFKWPEEWF